jgi:hypothetical protein
VVPEQHAHVVPVFHLVHPLLPMTHCWSSVFVVHWVALRVHAFVQQVPPLQAPFAQTVPMDS